MSGTMFYQSDPFVICLVLMSVLVAASEIGFWIKRRRLKNGSDTVEKSDIALIIGAVLTLLALLLGFTSAMSSNRFETRRQLVIKEANAIGTTFLRAKTLPEPRSSEIQELLRRYTALRVEIANSKDDNPAKLREMDNRTKQLHGLLWSHAAALAREKPTPITSLFLQTLNEIIDLHTKRLAAFRNRFFFHLSGAFYCISGQPAADRILFRVVRPESADPDNDARVSRRSGNVVDYGF